MYLARIHIQIRLWSNHITYMYTYTVLGYFVIYLLNRSTTSEIRVQFSIYKTYVLDIQYICTILVYYGQEDSDVILLDIKSMVITIKNFVP